MEYIKLVKKTVIERKEEEIKNENIDSKGHGKGPSHK